MPTHHQPKTQEKVKSFDQETLDEIIDRIPLMDAENINIATPIFEIAEIQMDSIKRAQDTLLGYVIARDMHNIYFTDSISKYNSLDKTVALKRIERDYGLSTRGFEVTEERPFIVGYATTQIVERKNVVDYKPLTPMSGHKEHYRINVKDRFDFV